MAGLTQDVAGDILSHLLNTLEYPPQERHRRRYSNLIEGNEAALRDYLFSCIRPEIFENFNRTKLPSWASLRKLNETFPTPPDAAGVYLNIIRDIDGHDRLYVGQATRMHQRIFKQHMNFRYRRDNKSLHYHAFDYSSWNNFITLAVLPQPTGSLPPWLRGASSELILNILEMWCALMFKTLPHTTLEDWLPEKYLDVNSVEWYPLNLALPLDQGDPDLGPTEHWAEALRNSNDALARGYASGNVPKWNPIMAAQQSQDGMRQPHLAAGGIAISAFAVGFIVGSVWQKK